MSDRKKIMLAGVFAGAMLLLYLLWNGSFPQTLYILQRRGSRILSMVAVAIGASAATLLFHKLTRNTILTPSVLGFERLYVLIQTLLAFTGMQLGLQANFALSLVLMIGVTLYGYQRLLRKFRHELYVLLLFGVVLGTFLQSLSTYMQMMMNPHEYSIVQAQLFASFSAVQEPLILVVYILLVVTLSIGYWPKRRAIDILVQDEVLAHSVGIDVKRLQKRLLGIIAILTSAVTALVGPTGLLGLVCVQVAYYSLKDTDSLRQMVFAALFGSALLIGSEYLFERIFDLEGTVLTVLNVIGGVYLIVSMLKEKRR